MNIVLTIYLIVVILLLLLSIVLDAIDVVSGEFSSIVVLCIAFPPIAICIGLIWIGVQLHKLCVKHKSKIRKFLRIK